MLLVILLATGKSVVGQTGPGSYLAVVAAIERDPQDGSKRQLLESFERDFRELFRELKPLRVIAMCTANINDRATWDQPEWKTRIERLFSETGGEVEGSPTAIGPRLVALVSQDPDTKKWLSSLEFKEDIILQRPGYPLLNCVTYVDKSFDLDTKQQAEKRLFESVSQFCRIYQKFSR
ncbi:hypothetical protein OAS39_13330 [Pirellulales bacterium]|nr:hypothetical protein [Pirellulales bacterium]